MRLISLLLVPALAMALDPMQLGYLQREAGDALVDQASKQMQAGDRKAALATLEKTLVLGGADATLARIEKDAALSPLRDEQVVARLRALARVHDSTFLGTPFAPELDDAHKIAGLSKLWSEAKFAFANFDLVPELDWDKTYLEYIPRVLATVSTLEYYRELMRMAALLRDGHTGVSPPRRLVEHMFASPGVWTEYIEGRVLVKEPAHGLERGDEITAIDDVDVHEYVRTRVAPWINASTKQDLEQKSYAMNLLTGAKGTTLKATVRGRNGDARQVTLTRDALHMLPQADPVTVKMLPGNIAYVKLNTFMTEKTAEIFEAAWDTTVAKSEAMIFDLRDNGGGNGGVGFRILATLTAKPFDTSRWRAPVYFAPQRSWGRGVSVWSTEKPDTHKPDGKRLYTKPIVVIIGPRTYSAAEDFTVAFDAMKRGTIMGEPTGGSTGNPLFVALPAGGGAFFCTKRDTYPDGREFVGIGIQPHVLVKRTVAGFLANRDEALEAAVARLSSK